MGQYYRVAFKREQDAKPIVNDRKVKGKDYIMAKLIEHGYMLDSLCLSVAKMLEDGKCRLAWVGDYADEDVEKVTGGELKYEDVWGEDVNETHVFRSAKNFSYGGKYLVNHTKKEYISFDRYVNRYIALKGVEESKWMLSPFTILTAVGNGRGGGDYFGLEMKRVGSWAWDEISIERTVPEGFTLLDIVFEEGMEDPKEETPSGKKEGLARVRASRRKGVFRNLLDEEIEQAREDAAMHTMNSAMHTMNSIENEAYVSLLEYLKEKYLG